MLSSLSLWGEKLQRRTSYWFVKMAPSDLPVLPSIVSLHQSSIPECKEK